MGGSGTTAAGGQAEAAVWLLVLPATGGSGVAACCAEASAEGQRRTEADG